MKKPMWLQYLEYIPIRIILILLNMIPYRISVWIGGVLGRLIYFIPSLRKTTIKNLSIAFSNEKSSEEIKNIAKRSLINFGKLSFEVMQIRKLNKKRLDKLVGYSEGSVEVINNLFERNKGVIGITGHIGNWELMGLRITSDGYILNHIVRPLDNILLDKYIEDFRAKFGGKIIPRKDSIRKGFRALRNNELVTFLVDQNWAIGGMYIPFFDRLAATSQGAPLFALRTKSPCIAAYCLRNPDDTHSITFKEIEWDYSYDNQEEFIFNNLKIINKYFENVIKEHPEQWLWLHPRWKSRPKNENDFSSIQYSG